MGESKNKSDKKNSKNMAVTYGIKDPTLAKIILIALSLIHISEPTRP